MPKIVSRSFGNLTQIKHLSFKWINEKRRSKDKSIFVSPTVNSFYPLTLKNEHAEYKQKTLQPEWRNPLFSVFTHIYYTGTRY